MNGPVTTPELLEHARNAIARIDERYRTEFAARPRSEHNLAALDALIDEATRAAHMIDRSPVEFRHPDVSAMRAAVATRLRALAHERATIERFGTMTPAELEFAGYSFAAQLVAMRVSRHLAGRTAERCDLGLFEESLARARRSLAGMDELGQLGLGDDAPDRRAARDGVRKLVADLTSLIERCHAAQLAGSERDRIERLDALAQDQLDLHAQLVAGSPPMTRRPALVERILDNLRRLSADASPLLERDPLLSAPPALRAIDETIAVLDSELRELRAARAGLGLSRIFDALAAAADDVIASYSRAFAGQDRSSVALELLGRLCDQLGEIQRQMIDIGIATGALPTENGRQRRATSAALSLEREYAAVLAVQNSHKDTGEGT